MSVGKLGPIPMLISSKVPNNGQTTGITSVQVKAASNGKSLSETGLSLREEGKVGPFSASTWKLVEILIAEVVGTGCLMFFGCMGLLGQTLPPLQGAIVFGMVVCTIIQIFGHISAAHLNPVVTVAAIILGKITPVTAVVYFVAEFVGAILGFGLLKIVTPCDLWLVSSGNGTGVCSTIPVPSLNDAQSLALEFLATSFLILVVCSVWDARNADKADSTPLKFAVTITVISIIVGPLTGASMNPARTLAPALINGVWTKHWIYWVGPLSAGFLATVFYQLVFDRKHPSKPEIAEEVPLTGVATGDKNTRNSMAANTDTKQISESQSQ
ncbi:aquaporin-like isoform X3 [Lycorma delicatula]